MYFRTMMMKYSLLSVPIIWLAYHSKCLHGAFVKTVQKLKSTPSPSNSPTIAPISIIQLSPTIVVTLAVTSIGTRPPSPTKFTSLTSPPIPIGVIKKFKRSARGSGESGLFKLNRINSPTVNPSSTKLSSTTRPVNSNPVLNSPTVNPSIIPSTQGPSVKQSAIPSARLSCQPSGVPTAAATLSAPTFNPSFLPTSAPSKGPSVQPSSKPPTAAPSISPTQLPPTCPSTTCPSVIPSAQPSSTTPSTKPSLRAAKPFSTTPTASLTTSPSIISSALPSSVAPSASWTSSPSITPSAKPSSKAPTVSPTTSPSAIPSTKPSSTSPSATSSAQPSSVAPSASWTASPSTTPSAKPSSKAPTVSPTSIPSFTPSAKPSSATPSTPPSTSPSTTPSTQPSSTIPSAPPSVSPSTTPSAKPSSKAPTASPTTGPSGIPSAKPSTSSPASASPSAKPNTSAKPPSFAPSASPSATPSRSPTASPIANPTVYPAAKPVSAVPSVAPYLYPSIIPTSKPPTSGPTVTPTTKRPPTGPSVVQPSSAKPSSGPPSPSGLPPPVAANSSVIYHAGGQVLNGTVNLYNIYLGRFDNANTSVLVNYFSQNIGSTDWFQILSSFSHQSGAQQIAAARNATFAGSAVVQPTAVALSVNDSYIQQALVNLFRKGTLPLDSNGIYTVMFRGDFHYPGWNNPYASQSFCSFHTTFTVDAVVVKLAVVGDPTSAVPVNSNCLAYQYSSSARTANKNPAADSIVTNYAHQLVGVITDYSGTGWYRNSGGDKEDAADLCNFDFGESDSNSNLKVGNRHFLVQRIYSPSLGGCTLTSKSVPSAAPTLGPTKRMRLEYGHNIRCYPTFSPYNKPSLSPSQALSSSISYHGGYVLGASYSLSIYNIYLGAFSNQTMNLMDYLGSQIGSSYWYNTLTNYYYYDPWSEQRLYVTNGTSFAGRTNLLPDAKGLTLTEDDIVRLLYTAMTDPYSDLIVDSGAVYEVMFRGDFNVSFNGGFWLRDWCSFHASFELPTGDVIKFTVLGDPSTTTSAASSLINCVPFSSYVSANSSTNSSGTARTPNRDLGADSMATSYAAQLAQTVTDFDGAWYSDQTGQELASLCQGNYGPNFTLANLTANVKVGKKKFLLQSIFHPQLGCTIGAKNLLHRSNSTRYANDDSNDDDDFRRRV